jgi:hypothetical protein
VFYVPTKGLDDWRARLADSNRHWAAGRSAMLLAACWEETGGFPPEVSQALKASPVPINQIEFLFGFPEHKTPLPGGARPSQSDVLVVASAPDRPFVIAVEGKVDEGFDKPVREWLGEVPSPGKLRRLSFLGELLGLQKEALSEIPYQLIHRSASAP